MAYDITSLINDLLAVIPDVEKELIERKSGIQGNGNIKQLEYIINELKQILMYAQSNTLPPRDKRYTAFSRYIVDEWDLNSPLGNRLCKLADKYKRLK